MNKLSSLLFVIASLLITSCSDNEKLRHSNDYWLIPFCDCDFLNKIDLNNLSNYANQTVPAYITKDNTAGNQ
jgi:cytochrome c peroxidase